MSPKWGGKQQKQPPKTTTRKAFSSTNFHRKRKPCLLLCELSGTDRGIFECQSLNPCPRSSPSGHWKAKARAASHVERPPRPPERISVFPMCFCFSQAHTNPQIKRTGFCPQMGALSFADVHPGGGLAVARPLYHVICKVLTSLLLTAFIYITRNLK